MQLRLSSIGLERCPPAEKISLFERSLNTICLLRISLITSMLLLTKGIAGGKGAMPPKFLIYLIVLCFERQCPKQNAVARLRSKYSPTQFWAGYATTVSLTFCKIILHITLSTWLVGPSCFCGVLVACRVNITTTRSR